MASESNPPRKEAAIPPGFQRISIDKLKTGMTVGIPGMYYNTFMVGRIANIRKPAWVTTDNMKEKTVTFEYEPPGGKGQTLNSYIPLSDSRYTFYIPSSPITKEQLDTLGVTYLPEVGPEYFKAKERFELSRKAGRRRSRRRKTRRRR